MIYTKSIATPANTAKATPLVTRMRVTRGVVYQVDVMFPPGPSGLVGVRIFHEAEQVWPTDADEFFYGDNTLVTFQESRLFTIDPLQFSVKTFNLDTAFEHTVQVRIGIADQREYQARYLPSIAAQYTADILLRQAEAQAEANRVVLAKLQSDLSGIGGESGESVP